MQSTGLHQLSLMVSAMCSEGWLVSKCGTAICRGNLVVVGVFSFHVAVIVGANEASVLCHLVEGWPRVPSLLDGVRLPSLPHCELSPQKWRLCCPSWGIGSGRQSSR
jgi:hypothetical protein